MYPKFLLHRSEKLHTQGSQTKGLLDPWSEPSEPSEPSNSLSSLSPQPAYRLLCEVEDKCTHPQICLGSFHNRFSKFISTLFLPHTAGIGTTLSIPVIEISMSTLCSEQGTQRDHLLLYPVLHVDTYSATNQACFQQELTQRSVHIIKWGGGEKVSALSACCRCQTRLISDKLLKVTEKHRAYPAVQSRLLQKGFSDTSGAGSPATRTSVQEHGWGKQALARLPKTSAQCGQESITHWCSPLMEKSCC